MVEDFAQDRLAALRALPSYAGEYLPPSLVGTHVARTVDACGTHGCFNLVHTDAEQARCRHALPPRAAATRYSHALPPRAAATRYRRVPPTCATAA